MRREGIRRWKWSREENTASGRINAPGCEKQLELNARLIGERILRCRSTCLGCGEGKLVSCDRPHGSVRKRSRGEPLRPVTARPSVCYAQHWRLMFIILSGLDGYVAFEDDASAIWILNVFNRSVLLFSRGSKLTTMLIRHPSSCFNTRMAAQ